MGVQTRLFLASVFCVALGCGGSEGDSKACKELEAEFSAAEKAQKATKEALSAAVQDVLAKPPAPGSEACNVEGLDWQKYTHLTPEVLQRGHLGDPFYLGEFRPGSTCTKQNPANVKNKLETLRSNIARTASGHRLFFTDISRVLAKRLPDNKYSPGSVRGRLYVWSDADAKFICTTEAFAESGAKVMTAGTKVKSEDLNAMLTRNAVGAGIKTLKRIDPTGSAPAKTPATDGGPAENTP